MDSSTVSATDKASNANQVIDHLWIPVPSLVNEEIGKLVSELPLAFNFYNCDSATVLSTSPKTLPLLAKLDVHLWVGKGLTRKMGAENKETRISPPGILTPTNSDTAVFPTTRTQAAEKAGMSTEQAQELLEKMSTPKVKNELKDTTNAACKYGVSNS